VREALDAGVRAFVVKKAPLEGLDRALETVAAGGTYVDPVGSGLLLRDSNAPELTDRERQVLRLLADGCSYQEVGRRRNGGRRLWTGRSTSPRTSSPAHQAVRGRVWSGEAGEWATAPCHGPLGVPTASPVS
jgi:hypothetical protein